MVKEFFVSAGFLLHLFSSSAGAIEVRKGVLNFAEYGNEHFNDNFPKTVRRALTNPRITEFDRIRLVERICMDDKIPGSFLDILIEPEIHTSAVISSAIVKNLITRHVLYGGETVRLNSLFSLGPRPGIYEAFGRLAFAIVGGESLDGMDLVSGTNPNFCTWYSIVNNRTWRRLESVLVASFPEKMVKMLSSTSTLAADIRLRVVAALATQRDPIPEVTEYLRTLIDSENRQIRYFARLGLLAIPNALTVPQAMEFLIQIAKQPEEIGPREKDKRLFERAFATQFQDPHQFESNRVALEIIFSQEKLLRIILNYYADLLNRSDANAVVGILETLCAFDGFAGFRTTIAKHYGYLQKVIERVRRSSQDTRISELADSLLAPTPIESVVRSCLDKLERLR